MEGAPVSPARGSLSGVMHVYAGNLGGGIESMLATMARSPAFAGQTYVLFHRGRLFAELERAGGDVVFAGPFRTSRPWQVLGFRRQLRAALASRSIHTVITHMAIPHALAAPVVGTRLLAYFAHERHRGSHWSERWGKRARTPDAVLTGSECVARTTHTMFPTVPADVVYYAAELGRPGSAAERAEVRAELHADAEEPVIISAARLVPYKGAHVLIEALGELAARMRFKVWFCGGPQTPFEERYLAELRARVKALGLVDRVLFLGQRGDVGRLLRAADVLCQANVEEEPFGIVFAEALGAGVPVVTSAFGGALEIVTPELGELVPPADPKALASGLERCLRDRAKAEFVREHGPAHANRLCSPAHVARRFEQALTRARVRRGHA
jgi:glycosyltransferase involved in cell wall biosynthesis